MLSVCVECTDIGFQPVDQPSSPMATARVNLFLKSVSCANLDPEVQLLFATKPTTIGWYSLSYNAASTCKSPILGLTVLC